MSNLLQTCSELIAVHIFPGTRVESIGTCQWITEIFVWKQVGNTNTWGYISEKTLYTLPPSSIIQRLFLPDKNKNKITVHLHCFSYHKVTYKESPTSVHMCSDTNRVTDRDFPSQIPCYFNRGMFSGDGDSKLQAPESSIMSSFTFPHITT